MTLPLSVVKIGPPGTSDRVIHRGKSIGDVKTRVGAIRNGATERDTPKRVVENIVEMMMIRAQGRSENRRKIAVIARKRRRTQRTILKWIH
jgi:hypothetical protein